MKAIKNIIICLAATIFVAGCTVGGNIVGADASVASADLPQSGNPVPPTSSDPFVPPAGGPVNDFSNLVIELVYKDPPGYNQSGQTIFYIGQTFDYELRISNYSGYKLRCLNIYAAHQYYNTGACGNTWWTATDPPVDTRVKGSNLAGESSAAWEGLKLYPYSMKVLTDSYTIPGNVCPGLSQTAIMVEYCGSCSGDPVLLYYNPEQGVFDPPAQP